MDNPPFKVLPAELVSLNFGVSAIPLGTKTNNAIATANFLCLDQQDWHILHLLLTRVVGDTGVAAAASSDALSNLAGYAEAAVKWLKRQAA